MFRRILVVFAISLAITRQTLSAPAVATSRQFIPSLPGFIPVYIRTGDTPLEDINPDLAEAFNSYAQKHARLAFGRSLDDIKKQENPDLTDNEKNKDISLVHLDDDLSLDENNDVSSVTPKTDIKELQHIQKIPRS